MTDIRTLPVLPLRDSVLFPGITTPIGAGRPGTLKAIQTAMDDHDRQILVVAQRENLEIPTPKLLHDVGTVARIAQVQRSRGKAVQVVLEGRDRALLLKTEATNGELSSSYRLLEDQPPTDPDDAAFQGLVLELRERATALGERRGLPENVVNRFLASVDDPGLLTDVVTVHLDITSAEKQDLLETVDVEDRLRAVLLHVERQVAVLEAQDEIKSSVQRELGDRQREMVLREQLKAIQRELGDADGDDDVAELRRKLDEIELPEKARQEVDRGLNRLERINRESMEHQVIRTHLETIAELPWSERSDDHLDLEAAMNTLEEDHYGLEDVKDRVIEFLSVHKLWHQREAREEARDDVVASDPEDRGRGPILLFAGPPGVGKTSIARSIARAMGREYVRVSLGGVRDEADIRGHRRTYVGAMPGRIIQGMKEAGTKNPVFLLDEVDKLGVSFQGDPSSALLEVLDPAQNDTFVDHYLGVPFDLSEVLFIATANFVQNIPSPLLDRMEMVEFSGYTEREKLEIARRFLVPRQRRRKALDEDQLEIGDEAITAIVQRYTREAGVRQLERELGKAARKSARRIATGESERVVIEPDDLRGVLGRPTARPEQLAVKDEVGVATGLFYTPAGGDILFVEAGTMPGTGKLTLTGQLGDVMKESAQAAWSWARARGESFGVDPTDFERDIHVHVPAGAIKKDGPSAGITIATSVVSALSGRPVRRDLAMTGELTLTGRVLPIGGVKEKVLGAVRAGITTIVLPVENESDLEDVAPEVRESLVVHPVRDLDEVLKIALRSVGPASDSRHQEAEAIDSSTLHH